MAKTDRMRSVDPYVYRLIKSHKGWTFKVKL